MVNYWQAKIHKHFDLALTPSIGVAARVLSAPLALTPSIGMIGNGISKGVFNLGLTASLGMVGAEHYVRDFNLDLATSVGMEITYPFGLGLTPSIGMTGVARYAPYYLGGSSVIHTAKTFTEDVPPATSCAILWCSHYSGLTDTISATLGGAGHSMTNKTSFMYHQFQLSGWYLSCLVLFNPPTGLQTVAITDPATNTWGQSFMAFYAHAGSAGTPITAVKSTASMSQAVASTDPDKLYAQCFVSGQGALSAYSPELRSPAADLSAGHLALAAGDAQGNGGTLTFSASQSDTSLEGGGIILPLLHP